MDSREEQFSKQYCPKLFTEEGMQMDVRDEQWAKHLYSKFVTEEERVTDSREEQNAYLLLVDYQYYTL